MLTTTSLVSQFELNSRRMDKTSSVATTNHARMYHHVRVPRRPNTARSLSVVTRNTIMMSVLRLPTVCSVAAVDTLETAPLGVFSISEAMTYTTAGNTTPSVGNEEKEPNVEHQLNLHMPSLVKRISVRCLRSQRHLVIPETTKVVCKCAQSIPVILSMDFAATCLHAGMNKTVSPTAEPSSVLKRWRAIHKTTTISIRHSRTACLVVQVELIVTATRGVCTITSHHGVSPTDGRVVAGRRSKVVLRRSTVVA